MNQMAVGDLNDWRYFAVVVDSGGFSAAARALGLPKSRLSRRVAGLEARLGVRLLQRSTRRLTLTDVGRQVLVHSQALLREAEAAEAAASALRAEASGLLRVSLPPQMLGRASTLGTVFTRYLADHPKVTLETVLTTRRVDLIAEGIDLALRVRTEDDEDPQWATRRLQLALSKLVASPGCAAAHGGLGDFAAVSATPALGSAGPDRRVHWQLTGPAGQVRDVSAPARLVCEDFALRLQAAVAGLGVTMLPAPMAAPDLAAGRLVEVMPGWGYAPAHLQAVYPTQRGVTPALRALLDALVAMDEPLSP